jgi:hypothetical protein
MTIFLEAYGMGSDLDPKQDPGKISVSIYSKKYGSRLSQNTMEPHHFHAG